MASGSGDNLMYCLGPAMKYGYSNARVKGMKGLLLKASEIDELLKVRTVDAVIGLLQRTHYREELVQFSLMHKGAVLVELAAGRHFEKIARKIVKMSPESDREIVKSLLKRWDIINLKTVINARRLGKTFEEIRPYLVAVGSLTLGDLERIAKADDRNLLEAVRRTEFGRDMFSESTAMLNVDMWGSLKDAAKSMDSIKQLQTMLDAFAYVYIKKHLVSKERDVERIRKLVRKEIDAKNITIVERLKALGFDRKRVSDSMLKGGSLMDDVVDGIFSSKDFKGVLSIAKQEFRGIEKIGRESGELNNVVDLEIVFEKELASEKLHAFYRSSLSVGTMLGFILLKEEELHNLRKIAKGKEFGMPEEKIRDMLVMVGS